MDKKSNQKLRTINKSLAKLDQISQLNWSKKDLNLDALTINNQVFNRVQTALDPRVFKESNFEHSQYESQLSQYAGNVALASKLAKGGNHEGSNTAMSHY